MMATRWNHKQRDQTTPIEAMTIKDTFKVVSRFFISSTFKLFASWTCAKFCN